MRTPERRWEIPERHWGDAIANIQDFVQGMIECKHRAMESPTGECELHRHGRKGWVLTPDAAPGIIDNRKEVD